MGVMGRAAVVEAKVEDFSAVAIRPRVVPGFLLPP